MALKPLVLGAVLCLIACAHVPSAPAREWRNTLSYDLPSSGSGAQLRYQFRWPEGTSVTFTGQATAPSRVTCEGCRQPWWLRPVQLDEFLPVDERVEATFVASGEIDTFTISSESLSRSPRVVFMLSPGPLEVIEEPRSEEALKRSEAAKVEAARADRAAEDQAKNERTRAQASAQKAEEEGKARCARGATVSRVRRNPGEAIVEFCDGASAVRRDERTWSVRFSLGGRDYEAFVERERANAEVASHNCSVLKTQAWCNRAADTAAAFQAKVELFIAKFRRSKSWYQSQAHQALQVCTAQLETEFCDAI